jgi:ribose transport system substrate-binding protein
MEGSAKILDCETSSDVHDEERFMHRSKNRLAKAKSLVFLLALMVGFGPSALALSAQDDTQWFVQEDFDNQMRQREVEPEGPADQPWVQMIEPEMVDTSQYATEGDWHVCFSNAGVNNPWRAVGYTTMQAEVELHSEITEFTHVDAEGNDNKQISDIDDLLGQDCDVLIVSPNTTAALTPAIEKACEQLPVIVFDRGVETDCSTTFIHPIGGYVFGAVGAEFLVEQVPEGGNILALRILPGVDVLETRWAAADHIFTENNMKVVGVEFSEGDRARVKSIVTDYIERYGQIDGVWMDAGQDAVAAIEAFEDLGMEVPPIVGEDQQDFLQKWSDEDLTAIAPSWPTFQWRTPIIAATMILSGEEVPSEWILPQPAITEENLDQYIQTNMPPQHYALCGCEDMPEYPQRWGGE